MATDVLKSFGNLQSELEEARSSLKGVDENLKRLIGRDPSEPPPRNNLKRPNPDDKGRPKLQTRNRGFAIENEEVPAKRRPPVPHVSVFKRLSDKVDDSHPAQHGPQRGMISKVIVTNKEVPSREEAIVAQNRDEKFKARNRRMFGALLGTLQKFQQEETKLKPREEKRAQLEKKIEEHEIKEKAEIRKERQELFLSRRRKQAEIKVIELKMLRMKEYAVWEESQKPRMSFITTKAKPHIHYIPRRMNDKSTDLLEKSKAEIEKLIEKKKEQIASELQVMEERVKRSFESKFGMKNKQDQVNNTDPKQQDPDPDPDQDDHFDHDAVLTETQLAVAEKEKMESQKNNDESEDMEVPNEEKVQNGEHTLSNGEQSKSVDNVEDNQENHMDSFTAVENEQEPTDSVHETDDNSENKGSVQE
ncbi:unnamed protein product [Acanthoscelides obtectus]|uniref:Pinin n=1 Tax=Acanthoscelides obtectus TaxID=200917 RepID=A0A9P0MI60_ACAOB|nr:unnamed protein product [Acanthoscelides obtectus]CAK1659570.1 Pinin [Acanthoscelides obtectus]